MAEYKEIKGFKVQSLASDPSGPVGQVWYNTATTLLKYQSQVGAWASGGTMIGSVRSLAGIGTQTAALAVGGTPPGGYPAVTTNSESYDGTSWTAGNPFNTARTQMGANAIGTQTAGQVMGGATGPPYVSYDLTEQYDGTSWSEKADLNTPRLQGAGGGIITAGFYAAGGDISGASPLANNETWDGTSWTEVNNVNSARRYLAGGGTMAAGLVYGGGPLPTISSLGLTESWDGTSWTATNNLNGARQYLSGINGPATSTSAVAVGGQVSPSYPANTGVETWDGTSWTIAPVLASGRASMAGTSAASATAGLVAGGQPVTNVTEEWTIANTVKTVTVS